MYSRKSIEKLVLGLVAFVLSGALMRFLTSGSDTLDGDSRAQVVLAFMYLGALFIAFTHSRGTIWVSKRNLPIFALLFLALLSTFWAQMPSLVFRRTIAVSGTTMVGVVLATRFSMGELLKLIRWVFRIGAALSIAVFVVSPNFAISGGLEGNGLRGVYNHKNHFGAIMALAFLVEWFFPETSKRLRVIRGFALFVFFGLLISSNSLTSIVALIVTIGAMQVFKIFHYRYKVPLPLLFGVVILVAGTLALIEVNSDSVTELMGRTSDLTGRTELWSYTFSMISKQPLLGFGYSGFWVGASEESLGLQRLLGWNPIYSHNGYIEVLLSLGMAGLLLTLVIVGTGIKRALVHAETSSSAQNLWPLGFLVFFLIHNIAECTILLQNSIEWALCIATVVGGDPALREALEPVEEEAEEQTEEYTLESAEYV
jgi:exopolysaccharide production protein ExoQ